MYCSAACLESMGEAWVNTFNARARPVPRLRGETAAVTVRSLVTLSMLSVAHMAPAAAAAAGGGGSGDGIDDASGRALLAFGYGQLAYGAALFAVLVAHSHSTDGSDSDSDSGTGTGTGTGTSGSGGGSGSFTFLPSAPSQWGYNEVALLRLCATTTCMSVFKHVLTEADKVSERESVCVCMMGIRV
jgi:hypothetical protein